MGLSNSERVLKWQRDFPEKVNAKQRKWRAENKEKARAAGRERMARYRAKNVEKMRAKSNQWFAEHPEQGAVYANRRRAKERAAGPSYTLEEWKKLLEKYDGKCLKCGTKENISADHVVPLSRGGSGTIDNIQPLCKSCNSSKGTKMTDYRPDSSVSVANA